MVLKTLAYLSSVDLTPILRDSPHQRSCWWGEGSTMNTSERTRRLAELLPKGRWVEVPGASGMCNIRPQPNAWPSGETL